MKNRTHLHAIAVALFGSLLFPIQQLCDLTRPAPYHRRPRTSPATQISK